jgi:hypothetical protein
MESEINVLIDYLKFENNAALDGLKGYPTNIRLSKYEITLALW